MTEPIVRQIERFAPGFRDRILALMATAAALEAYNPNYVGGDMAGRTMDLGQLFTRPTGGSGPLFDAGPGDLPVLGLDAARRRRARHVRPARRAIGEPAPPVAAARLLGPRERATCVCDPNDIRPDDVGRIPVSLERRACQCPDSRPSSRNAGRSRRMALPP